MSVTSGFFNSLNGDRKYNAETMSAIFDGVIRDGIFETIGTCFTVSASGGNELTIGPGRAWFNSKWISNDAPIKMVAPASDLLVPRYDAVVIDVNTSDEVRECSIKIISGTASAEPVKPEMESTDYVHQYPLCYILRGANTTSIEQTDIENAIGTESTPFVTSILEIATIDMVTAQWNAEWDKWTAAEKREFLAWFDSIKDTLDGDVAAKLTNAVVELQNRVAKLEGHTFKGILAPGETEMIFTHDAIVDGCKIEPYTSIYGVNPTNIVAADGVITLTFKRMETELGVEVVIK